MRLLDFFQQISHEFLNLYSNMFQAYFDLNIDVTRLFIE